MDLGSILLGLALLLIVAFIVARPLLDGRLGEGAERDGEGVRLLFEREQLLSQLRDLDFDHATGKLAAEDYTAQRAGLVAQGVAILKQLDALGLGAAPSNGASPSPEDEIEAAIAAARSRPPKAGPAPAAPVRSSAPRRNVQPSRAASAGAAAPALYCPNCGRPARSGDQFCGGCGQPLPVAKTPS
jgi:hypothetical protein